mgnify:CR=1 FL=1
MEDNLLGGYVNLERFWANVKKTDSCWFWISRAVTGNAVKYGLVAIRVMSMRGAATRQETAHRISYELANGPIPAGLKVLHSCDYGLCVNPAHLRVGTQPDNVEDAVRRNRYPRGGRTPGVILPRAPLPTRSGETHWFAKLSDAQVADIRTRYAETPTLTMNALAREFKVSQPLIRGIITGASRRSCGGPISKIRSIYGGSTPTSKLTEAQVADLRARASAGATIHELAAQFDIAPQTASKIARGQTWKHVAPAPTPILPGRKNLTRRQVMTIRQRHAAGTSQARIAEDYGVSRATISMLVRGLTHPTPPPAPPRVC